MAERRAKRPSWKDLDVDSMGTDVATDSTKKQRNRLLMATFLCIVVFKLGVVLKEASFVGVTFETPRPQVLYQVLIIVATVLFVEYAGSMYVDIARKYLTVKKAHREAANVLDRQTGNGAAERVLEFYGERWLYKIKGGFFISIGIKLMLDIVVPAVLFIVSWVYFLCQTKN